MHRFKTQASSVYVSEISLLKISKLRI